MPKKCRISVSPILVLMLCLCIYAGFEKFTLCVLLSVLSHELGHIVYLLLRKQEIQHIRFRLLGASIETAPLSYTDEMLCSFCGPLVNLVLWCLLRGKMSIASVLNLGLFLFNMLPIYPLDGGRILRAALLMFFRPKTVLTAVRWVSFFMSLLLMFGGVSLCILLQQGLFLSAILGIVIIKLHYDAGQDGY